MIKVYDDVGGYSGRIDAFWRTQQPGARDLIPFLLKSNVITYAAADLMARIVAGDSAYCPRHIGFIYGTNPSPLLVDPDTLPDDTKRLHDWPSITAEVAAINGNILVAPLALSPSIGVDGSSARYTGNAVVFTSHTGIMLEYAFPTTGSTFAASLYDLETGSPQPVYIYQVLLLNRWEQRGVPTYTPFARSALGTAPFTAKPVTNDLAVYWTLSFR